MIEESQLRANGGNDAAHWSARRSQSKEEYKPESRKENAGNRHPPPSGKAYIPNKKGYHNEKHFDNNIRDPNIVHPLGEINAFLPDNDFPRIGQTARKSGDEDSRDSPESGESDKYQSCAARSITRKELLDQETKRYPSASHVGDV